MDVVSDYRRSILEGRGRGTTLLELLVACTLFVTILTAVLSFYTYASNVTRRQQAISEGYRAAVERLDRLETMVALSRVYDVTPSTIAMTRLSGVPRVSKRWCEIPGEGGVLRVEATRVVWNHDKVDYTVFVLLPDENLVFERKERVLTIKLTGRMRTEGHAAYSLDRTVILENLPPI